MTQTRRHFVGDGCDPAHVLTIIEPEDPDDVRTRDAAHWHDLPDYGTGRRPPKPREDDDHDG